MSYRIAEIDQQPIAEIFRNMSTELAETGARAAQHQAQRGERPAHPLRSDYQYHRAAAFRAPRQSQRGALREGDTAVEGASAIDHDQPESSRRKDPFGRLQRDSASRSLNAMTDRGITIKVTIEMTIRAAI